MRKRITSVFFSIIMAIGIMMLTAGNYATAVSETDADKKASKEACLTCHGPFEKLAAAPKNYASESGEKINPHVYVPHNRKEAKSIGDCVNCHETHPVPWPAKGARTKANADWCYSCHHKFNFTSCKACH